jgi:hypothetical protein
MATKERSKVKSKLTLSVDPKYVYMLRKAGARRGRSITELVEELAIELDKEDPKEEELSDFVKRNMGVLAGQGKTRRLGPGRSGGRHSPQVR